MAFPSYRAREVAPLRVGDPLFLYTTRGCFHNPTRDRGRVIGIAEATSVAEQLDAPVEFAGREFSIGCHLRLSSLAPYGLGVELGPLVESMEIFANGSSWATRMRRPLVPLTNADRALLDVALQTVAGAPEKAIHTYLTRTQPGRFRGASAQSNRSSRRDRATKEA
jgi:hypothetical protein